MVAAYEVRFNGQLRASTPGQATAVRRARSLYRDGCKTMTPIALIFAEERRFSLYRAS